MKTIIKGMTLLLAGVSFMACSKDVAYDENAQKEAQQAKAQAELAQKYATYQADFVKTFGSIAPGHQWGFDQTTTRGAVTNSDLEWVIPENFRRPRPGAEGIDANTVAANIGNLTKTLEKFNFNNYWLQQVDKGKHHTEKGRLQAYDSNANNGQGDWVDVTNFTQGDNPNGEFKCANINSYINNNALQSTTLMMNMGEAKEKGTNYQFRFGSDNNWSYDYWFMKYNNQTYLCLKHTWRNGNGTKTEDCWWIIRIGEAEAKEVGNKFEGRVFCEDMGEIGDYDFNDLVMDVVCDKDNNIDITIVAAGGMLPIYIGGKDEENGGTKVTLGKMTNTGENTNTNYQTIHYAAKADGSAQFASVRDIPIWVNPGGEALPYELEAKPNEAPQKICTFLSTKYPDEYVRIDNAYSDFADWVKTATPTTWSEHLKWWLVDLNLTNNTDTEPIIEDDDD